MALARGLLCAFDMRWCLISLLAACIGSEDGPDPVALPLTSLPGFKLPVDAAETGLRINLTTVSEYTQPCPRLLPSFVATIDGTPMSVNRGSVSDIGLDSPDYVCDLPFLYTTVGGQLVHIADDHATFDIDLGDATSSRMMQVSPATVVRGGTFDITWSSAMDLANMPTVDVYIGAVAATATVDPAGIHVTTPDLSPTSSVPVDVRVTSIRPCPYPNCRILATHHLRQTIAVE